jgi:hypothetical protein
MSSADETINSEDFEPSFDQLGMDWTACRRMCAGTYLDSEFRDRLLREVYNARSRRIAPSYGYDLVPVLVHAWRAWRLEMAQHIIALAVFLVFLLAFPLDTIIAASILAALYFLHSLVRLTADFVAYYRGRDSALEISRLRTRRRFILSGMLASAVVFGAAVLVLLYFGHHNGEPPRWPDSGSLADSVFLLTAILVIVAMTAALRQIKISRLHTTGSNLKHSSSGRLDTISFQQHHPFTVYSGFTPFIGSGTNIRIWSFAQRLTRAGVMGALGRDYGDELPFTTLELIDSLRAAFTSLREDENPETRLAGLQVTDHVLVEGTHAIPYMYALRSDPESTVVAEHIDYVISHSSDVARHYLACQVASWGGEVVTSIFIHVSLQGRTLYLEYSVYALMPTRKEYQVIDEVGATGPASVMRAAGKSILRFPYAVVAPQRLTQAPRELLAAMRAQEDGTLRPRRRTNIGSQVSAREIACSDADESYFQFRDVVQHSKIVERRLVTTVGEFLKDRGVDTSEFEQRATTILNQGIINAGAGTVNFNANVSFNQGGDTSSKTD